MDRDQVLQLIAQLVDAIDEEGFTKLCVEELSGGYPEQEAEDAYDVLFRLAERAS